MLTAHARISEAFLQISNTFKDIYIILLFVFLINQANFE